VAAESQLPTRPQVARELGLSATPPPPGWGPLATFAAVCTSLARESCGRSSVVRVPAPGAARRSVTAGARDTHMPAHELSVSGSVFGQLGQWVQKRGAALSMGASQWGAASVVGRVLASSSSSSGGGAGWAVDEVVGDAFESDDEIDGWDIVDLPSLPPPPSHSADVEHWARAMIVDAK
jgi:hypothetical protein